MAGRAGRSRINERRMNERLQAVERLCEETPRGSGLVLNTGNSRYLPFYESEGFRSLGKIRLGDFEDHVLFREVLADEDQSSEPRQQQS